MTKAADESLGAHESTRSHRFNMRRSGWSQMKSSEGLQRSRSARLGSAPQTLFSSDLKPVVLIPINTGAWGGQRVLSARCLFFSLSGVYRRTAPHKHGNIAAPLAGSGGNDPGFNSFYRSIHFITAFYHQQTGAIIFWVNDRWCVWRLKEGKKMQC